MNSLEAVMTITNDEDATQEDEIAAMQSLIDSGMAWHMEGSIGRACMDAIKTGYCTVGKQSHTGAYGQHIPAINELEKGTQGTPEYVKRMSAERE